jgi:hypothetical protein
MTIRKKGLRVDKLYADNLKVLVVKSIFIKSVSMISQGHDSLTKINSGLSKERS